MSAASSLSPELSLALRAIVELQDARFLVTGGGGFLGGHIITALLEIKGVTVNCFDVVPEDKLSKTLPWLGSKRVKYIQGKLQTRRVL
jgi:nucleoside-diphosphate-sugar epimerase